MEKNKLKKVSFIDKIRNKIREIMRYKEGKRFIDETEPLRKKYSEIELSRIANIEQKLKDVLDENLKAGKIVRGIEKNDAEELIRWVIERDREILEKGSKEGGLKNDSLFGCCGLSQGIVTTLLENMGLQPLISNVAETIMGEGHGIHSFNTVNIPIKDEAGEIKEKAYLIDATVRQFFVRDEFSMSGRFIKDKRFGNKVAPLPGYWCINIPGGKQFAHDILRDGFVELTPQNAKIYGDSFTLAEKKDVEYRNKYKEGITIPVSENRNIETGIDGKRYIEWFADKNRQIANGIDFAEGELEEAYGDLMKTPLMKREEHVKSMAELSTTDISRELEDEKEDLDK